MSERWVSCSLFLLLSLAMVARHLVDAGVPAVFIFGDSTVDVGTNNYISEPTPRANFPHNGVDYPGSISTGRFSNGFNSADYLAQLMGFPESPPPFLDLIKSGVPRLREQALKGVNFASAGSGINKLTGLPLGNVITLEKQIQQFGTVRQNLIEQLDVERTDSMLSKSPFLISIGSNDIFQNFILERLPGSKQLLMTHLKRLYEGHLRMLHSLGARKFGIISVAAIGCCPSKRNETGECFEEMNGYARDFYSTVEDMLSNLSSKLERMKYSLGNTYEMVMNIIENPLPYNLTELTIACCGMGKYNGQKACVPRANLCSNRDEHLFWDFYHPTQAASKLAAQTLYDGPLKFVTPINFRQLAEDDD